MRKQQSFTPYMWTTQRTVSEISRQSATVALGAASIRPSPTEVTIRLPALAPPVRGEQGTEGRGGGRKGVSPTEEITFDLFGAVGDFNDVVTSGDWTEKVHVTVLSVNACQGLSGNDVLEKARCSSRVTF
ncbi:unnamed protein product, partial [Iphiclides podalirius]